MKIGLILANYNCFEYLPECLEPWIDLKKLGVLDLQIACLDGLFSGFEMEDDCFYSTDGSLDWLQDLYKCGDIDFLKSFKHLQENVARNIALDYLKDKVDYVISIGADEFFTQEEIIETFRFVEKNPEIAYFRINYRNLVFTKNQYIDNFDPKRIWKVNLSRFVLNSFNYDDDCSYYGKNVNSIFFDKEFPSLTIPKNICHPLHETWVTCERSRKKIAYQNARNGWVCSFKWEDNQVKFNEEYYKDKPLPIVYNV